MVEELGKCLKSVSEVPGRCLKNVWEVLEECSGVGNVALEGGEVN